jgi:malyl-CoA/(S)-citramalyl-CoA lyase
MQRLRRTELAVPGSSWKMIGKATGLEADAVFLDLEDAVAPDAKVAARQTIIRALNELDWGHKLRVVRVNALDTAWGYRDIVDVVEGAGPNIDLVLVPKINRPADVVAVEVLLGGIERALGLERPIGIEVLIETAQAMACVEAIAASSPRLQALIFGPADYAAALGMRVTDIGGHGDKHDPYPGHRMHYALSRMVVAAKAAGLAAIDGPYGDFSDAEGLAQSARLALALGCDGKWAIHPSQLAPLNALFAPSAEQVAAAQRIVAAYEQGLREGRGAIAVDGKLVDAASIKLAQTILRQAARLGG